MKKINKFFNENFAFNTVMALLIGIVISMGLIMVTEIKSLDVSVEIKNYTFFAFVLIFSLLGPVSSYFVISKIENELGGSSWFFLCFALLGGSFLGLTLFITASEIYDPLIEDSWSNAVISFLFGIACSFLIAFIVKKPLDYLRLI